MKKYFLAFRGSTSFIPHFFTLTTTSASDFISKFPCKKYSKHSFNSSLQQLQGFFCERIFSSATEEGGSGRELRRITKKSEFVNLFVFYFSTNKVVSDRSQKVSSFLF